MLHGKQQRLAFVRSVPQDCSGPFHCESEEGNANLISRINPTTAQDLSLESEPQSQWFPKSLPEATSPGVCAAGTPSPGFSQSGALPNSILAGPCTSHDPSTPS